MSRSAPGAARPRIALVQQGDPAGAGSWSGVPAGLGAGLREEGCEVIPIDVAVPRAGRLARLLRMSWADQSASELFARASSRIAERALRREAPLDGVVMIGSGYSLPREPRYVTFEDMTVAQALRQFDDAYRSLGERGARRWRRRQLANYERSAGCCVASEWAAASVREEYGVDAAKVHVVGMGTNLKTIPTSRAWDTPRFLFVGVDWRRKRGAAVVEAFAEVRRRFPTATLDLVGGHPPIDADGVIGHGLLPLGSPEGRRLYTELLATATCLLMPSTFEPFGIAYLDAAAAGIASIGTTVGGAADAVGDCGRLVAPDDRAALVEAMIELADPDTARRLGGRAQERSARFTWGRVARRVLDALTTSSRGAVA